MSKPAMHHAHPSLAAWTVNRFRFWFRACDDCGKRRFRGFLRECYPPSGSSFGWWWGCDNCVNYDSHTCDLCKKHDQANVIYCGRCAGLRLCFDCGRKHVITAVHANMWR